MRDFRDAYEHHLMIKVAATAHEATKTYLAGRFPSSAGDAFECTADEGTAAFLHRFAVAGAAVRYRAIHDEEIEDIVALDIALRRNDRDWYEVLPDDLAAPVVHKLYYGHFFCHVFHQDYLIAKGHDVVALEHKMWALLDQRGAEYPAEHNVGHLYPAKPTQVDFYRELDPRNAFNPGVGQVTKRANWTE
jgi:D-lactate dehydrogenase